MNFLSKKNLNPRLGIGLRPAHFSNWQAIKNKLPFFEVLADHLIYQEGGPIWEKINELTAYREPFLHSVGLNIGSFDALDKKYILQLKHIADRIGAKQVSDHLCFTRAGGISSFELLPIPKTKKMLAYVCDRVLRVQDHLQRSLVLENISQYLDYSAHQMTDGQFLSLLAEKTGCGILLDINNIEVSAFNLNKNFHNLLDSFDLKYVKWMHLAGYTVYPDYYFDTHDQKVSDLVLSALKDIFCKTDAPIVLEWDEEKTPFDLVWKELERISDFLWECETFQKNASKSSLIKDSSSVQLKEFSLDDFKKQEELLILSFWKKETLSADDWLHNQRLMVYRKSLAARTIQGACDSIFAPLKEAFGVKPLESLLAQFFQEQFFRQEDLIDNFRTLPAFVQQNFQGKDADRFFALSSTCLIYWDLIHGKDPDSSIELSKGDLSFSYLWFPARLTPLTKEVDLAALWKKSEPEKIDETSGILFLKVRPSICLEIKVCQSIYPFVIKLIEGASLQEAMDDLEDMDEKQLPSLTEFLHEAVFYSKEEQRPNRTLPVQPA